MKRICLVALFCAGCAATPPQTHHTATIAAPTSRIVKTDISRAEAANTEARVVVNKSDAKRIIILRWLRETKAISVP
jgi:PBP1b-binding outer membrane lipoprotein LpoB